MAGCGDVLSLADLQTAKKHQIFEAEVITGLQGGVAGGQAIDYATNQVTGQTQKTMPAILRDVGFQPASFDFVTGGTLGSTDRNKAVLWPLSSGGDGAYYSWQGALPKVIPANSTPASTGGVAPGAWAQLGDLTLRQELFTTKKYITWTTPLVWATLKDCFESGFTEIRFPEGTYLLSGTLQPTITGSKKVTGDLGAVIKLDANVRKNMMVFVGDGTNTFEWENVEVDGNWENQGPETITGGVIDDVSHGLIVSSFKTAHIHDFYVHDCMGHHINHSNNDWFIAERIRIRAHVSALKPDGGARGDGITGCSVNNVIRDIKGFSTDDFIAVTSGITWLPGLYPTGINIKSVLVENIRCETYNYAGVDRYCWTGVSVGVCYGSVTEQVVVRNVTGDTKSRGIGVTAESYGPDYYGSFRTVNVSDISLCVHGDTAGFTTKINSAHVVIGKEFPNGVSSTNNNFAWSVNVSNIQCRGSAGSLSGVFVGHLAIRDLSIDNIQCTYDDATQVMRAVVIAGQKDITNVHISNITQQGNAALSDTDRAGRCAIESYYGGTGALELTASGFTRLLNNAGTSYVPNVSFVQVSGQNKTVPRIFGDSSVICDLDTSASGGVKIVPLAHGIRFSTPGLGLISYSKITDVWTFHEFAVQWDSTNYGIPATANFPNFGNFGWRAGTVVPVKGSPYGERKAYVALSATPTFAPNDGVCWSTSTTLRSSGTSPISFSPGCIVWAYLPAQADAGWAYQNIGMVQYIITDNPNRAGSKRVQYDSSGTSAQRVQSWNGSSWGTWQNFSV